MSQKIERALVIGAGVMGAGIAEVCARAGLETRLVDMTRELAERGLSRIRASLDRAVEKGKISAEEAGAAAARITAGDDRAAARSADLVIEAAPEDIALKLALFREVSAIAPPEAILASNTSSLSVTELAAAATGPGRVIGLHFFNPPPVMPLLEIVRAEQTEERFVLAALALAARLEKEPIVVRDRPGFATSRLGVALGLEAIRMLESGVASIADIDRAMELGYKHPMGPLKLTDLVGLDVRLAIAEHLTRELGPRFLPPPLLRQLVRAGKLGQKTGEGFYRWVDGRPEPP